MTDHAHRTFALVSARVVERMAMQDAEIGRLRAENEAMRSALVFWKYDHDVQVEELREDIAQALIGYRDRVGGEPYRIADYLLVDFGRALDALGAPLRLLIPEDDWGINLEHVEVRRG